MNLPADDPNKLRPSRLGRGLSALIGEVESIAPAPAPAPYPTVPAIPALAPSSGLQEIPVELIRRNPAQPRKTFEDELLHELADSIRSKGILQAILVRPDPKDDGKYQIIAGERRWRAAKLAGLKTMPAVIRSLDELDLLEVGIIENVQRTDLNPIEEAEAYEALIQRFGRTQESLASATGKSRAHVANTLRLLQLPEDARDMVRDGKVSAGHARAALGTENPESLLRAAAEKGLSVRDLEALARAAREAVPGYETKTRKPVSAPTEKDVDTEALEADLTRALGLEVDIRHGPKGGELRIRYGDLEQLDEVCRKLSARRGE